jgi:hypothetical protein
MPVMTQQNKELPRQNTQRNLACFNAPFGILNIGGKREKASPRGEAFCFSPAPGYQPPATSYCPLFTVHCHSPGGLSQFACLNLKQKFPEEGRRQANHATTPQGGRRRVVPGRPFSRSLEPSGAAQAVRRNPGCPTRQLPARWMCQRHPRLEVPHPSLMLA